MMLLLPTSPFAQLFPHQKVEYLHVDLGSLNFSSAAPRFGSSGVVAVSSRFTEDIVRVGADYHF